MVIGSVEVAGTIGKSINKFGYSCEEIPKYEQKWTIEPELPEGLEINNKNGTITGKLTNKYSMTHQIKVSGNSKHYSKDIQISILKSMKTNLVNYVLNLTTDSTSLGHGICEFIDNSIDAGAKKIEVLMNYELWDHEETNTYRPWVIVKDDGSGILANGKVTDEALEDALGIATSPDKEYDETRLGAYGVGLPAAALTSAIYCTVFTKSNGVSAIGHMSFKDIEENKILRFFGEDDIYDYLKKTKSWKIAKGEFDNIKDSGTLILLQDHYQIRRTIIPPTESINHQQFKEDFNKIKTRLSDYLGLIYHKFLSGKGAELRDKNGKVHLKKIKIFAPKEIGPIDPLMEHTNASDSGSKGTHIHTHSKASCSVRSESQWFTVKMAVIPGQRSENGLGRILPNGKDYDKAMANAMLVYNSQEGSQSPPSPKEMQGLYFYRNQRLIEFGGWKSIYSMAPQAQVARVAIYTPPGLPVHNPRLNILNDFAVDQRKRSMTTTANVEKIIKEIIREPRTWHPEDAKKHTLFQRAQKRSEYDGLGSRKNKKRKTKKIIQTHEAVIEPSEINTVILPHKFVFKDLTPGTTKNPKVRKWELNNIQIGTKKIQNHEITEEGEYKLTLTVAHGQKTWQKSIKFNCKKPEKIKLVKNNTSWNVAFKDLSPDEPPLMIDKKTYVINTRNPDWEIIVKTMWLGIKNE